MRENCKIRNFNFIISRFFRRAVEKCSKLFIRFRFEKLGIDPMRCDKIINKKVRIDAKTNRTFLKKRNRCDAMRRRRIASIRIRINRQIASNSPSPDAAERVV